MVGLQIDTTLNFILPLHGLRWRILWEANWMQYNYILYEFKNLTSFRCVNLFWEEDCNLLATVTFQWGMQQGSSGRQQPRQVQCEVPQQLHLLVVEEQCSVGLCSLFLMEKGGSWTEVVQLIHLLTGDPASILVPWKLHIPFGLVWRYCFLAVWG